MNKDISIRFKTISSPSLQGSEAKKFLYSWPISNKFKIHMTIKSASVIKNVAQHIVKAFKRTQD